MMVLKGRLDFILWAISVKYILLKNKKKESGDTAEKNLQYPFTGGSNGIK